MFMYQPCVYTAKEEKINVRHFDLKSTCERLTSLLILDNFSFVIVETFAAEDM